MKIFIASDHAGFEFKKLLLSEVFTFEAEWLDLGTNSEKSVDYPDFAELVATKVKNAQGLGLLICGSGTGMAIAANRSKGVRAANCWDVVSARLAREHNDANILCLGSRLIPFGLAKEIVRIFYSTTFLSGRHENRIRKID